MITSTFRPAFSAVVLSLFAAVLPSTVTATNLPRHGVCEREGGKLVGKKPVPIGKGVRTPKKVRDVKINYPDLPAKTRASGRWLGEALLDSKGKVAHVWALREVQLTPPFPAFNQSIVDAIRQWEFEPVVVKGEVTPVCMTVTVNIDLL